MNDSLESPLLARIDASQDPDPVAAAGTLQGHIDGIGRDGAVEGWATEAAAPHRPVEVRALDGERLVAIGTADRPRPDVAAAGFGETFCGYSLILPDELFDGAVHTINVVARSAVTPVKLLGSVTTTLDQRPPRGGIAERNWGRPSPGRDQAGPQGALQGVKAKFLADALNTALARIDELERSQRAMNAERDVLRGQLRLLEERLTHDLNAFGSAPWNPQTAAYLGSIVRTVSVTQRRDLWLRELAERRLSGSIFSVMPHDGAAGPLSLLVWGSGGIGDLLYLSTIVRELFLLFENCRIIVLHENPAVTEVFANNPYVSGAIFLEGRSLYDFVHTIHSLDIFDLVAEVRYCVTYTAPPLSRAPHAFLSNASYRSAYWQKYVRYRWPHLNNIFGNEVMARGLTKLGLVGQTALLPIDSTSELDFFLPAWFPDLLTPLIGSRFVTIHHGSDKKMAATGGVQTKNLPIATWVQIVARLSSAGLKVVQLGEQHEGLVDGVDLDLRGKTSLSETAFVLKRAAAHIDTEGGLVHMARAMHTRSVVVFGPTPVGFFGYPQNINIAPPLCGNCWWTTDRWATQCPRDLAEPECMASHAPEMIAERAIELVRRTRAFQVDGLAVAAEADLLATCNDRLATLAGPAKRGIVLLGPAADLQFLGALERPAGEAAFLVPVGQFVTAQEQFGHVRRVMPAGEGSLAVNSGSLDWLLMVGGDPFGGTFLPACLEAARCLAPGGRMRVALPVPAGHSVQDIWWAVELAQARQVGGSETLAWPEPGTDAPALPASGPVWLILDVAERPALDEAAPLPDAPTLEASAQDVPEPGAAAQSAMPMSDAIEGVSEIPVAAPLAAVSRGIAQDSPPARRRGRRAAAVPAGED